MFHVVDDQPYLCELLTDILEMFGCEVESFTSALDYLEYVKSNGFIKPVATLTDVGMPIMNGYEMMESVLAIHPGMQFVVISGEPAIRHEYKHLACMYLLKPFRPTVIEEIVTKLKRCSISGPSAELGCKTCGDSDDFVGNNWSCPKG